MMHTDEFGSRSQRKEHNETEVFTRDRETDMDVIDGYKALNIVIFYMNRLFSLHIYHLGKLYEKQKVGDINVRVRPITLV